MNMIVLLTNKGDQQKVYVNLGNAIFWGEHKDSGSKICFNHAVTNRAFTAYIIVEESPEEIWTKLMKQN